MGNITMPTHGAKVFNLSLPRTGTQSMHNFLSSIGYSSVHDIGRQYFDFKSEITENDNVDSLFNKMEQFDNMFECFNDYPYPILHKQYLKKYPSAKFILVTRDFDSWFKSIDKLRKHVNHLDFPHISRIFYNAYYDFDRIIVKSQMDMTKDEYYDFYLQHIKSCQDTFSGLDNFLHVDLNDKGITQKILTFLNTESDKLFANVDFFNEIFSTNELVHSDK